MIELLGKWSRLPYWQCLTLDQTHPDFQRQLRDWYEEGEAGIHQELVRQSLISKGYLPPDAPAFTAGNPQWREAIGRFQADNGMVVSGVVDFNTYERALRDFVAVGADGHITRIGWNTKSAAPVTTAPRTWPWPRATTATEPPRLTASWTCGWRTSRPPAPPSRRANSSSCPPPCPVPPTCPASWQAPMARSPG
ncbi:peptidoglycan-binding domain-containing protein, partial [Burkholderia sola]|uniref:peptidoglycan-binding domain-containing protein n=1 Tax=Burkholderia sola TaxID=2843302 RepID=UPI00338E5AA1